MLLTTVPTNLCIDPGSFFAFESQRETNKEKQMRLWLVELGSNDQDFLSVHSLRTLVPFFLHASLS